MKILIESELCSVTKDFPSTVSLATLCDRIYPLTGIEPKDMKFTMKDEDGSVLKSVNAADLGDSCQVLKNIRISYIFVEDISENPVAGRLKAGDEDVTFKLSEEDYAQRENTLLAWKARNKMGRFDPAYKEQLGNSQRRQAESLQALELNQRCSVKTADRPERRGWLRFIGTIPEISGSDTWCGVEFDEPVGKNNGSINGTTYFGPVNANCGGFVKPSNVKTGFEYTPFELEGLSSEDEV